MMPKLSAEESPRVIGHLQAGVNPKQVANLFDVHLFTVYRLKEKFEQDNTVKRRVGSGRHRKISFEDDARMVEAHDHFRIPEETSLDFNVSGRTVSRRLKDSGLRAKKAATKPYLKPEHREARVNCVLLFEVRLLTFS